jgi:ABC-type antimicrobial peptide transport system permease subunit
VVTQVSPPNFPHLESGIGVLAFLASKRTRGIGIRMALGARRKDVLWLVIKEGAKFSFAGIALGLAGAMVFCEHPA